MPDANTCLRTGIHISECEHAERCGNCGARYVLVYNILDGPGEHTGTVWRDWAGTLCVLRDRRLSGRLYRVVRVERVNA